MIADNLRLTREDPRGETPLLLIRELSKELAALYPDSHGGDGSGAFKPEDVLVARAGFVVAWLGDEAVGCGALRPMENPDVGEVKRMYVRKSVRGQGISRRILSALEEMARDYGYRKLMLETGQHQKEAIGLYESSGYQRMDCYGIYEDEPLSMCYEKALIQE
jgi:GNAT superfamily N-acetyltransferase